MYPRRLNLPELLKKKSFFLFGPRATGKSTLIKQQFSADTPYIDLLDMRVFSALHRRPYELEEIIATYERDDTVLIDEIQKVPPLLNEVHRLIESKGTRFLLTGSSARQLRKSGVNLLAGRAWEAQLFSLSAQEIPNFNLNHYLLYGGLPAVYSSEYPRDELKAYIKTYLSEEIQAEAFIRKIPAFSRFLQVAALTSGSMINFTSLANDTGVSQTTIREYYQILEDTFLGFMLPAWQKSAKRKPVATSKFYLFDIGLRNALTHTESLSAQTDAYGQAFEHFMAMELRAALSYNRSFESLSYWRTQKGHEVDFIIGDRIAIEVKASHEVSDKHLKNLKLLQDEGICEHYFLASLDPLARKKDGIHLLHWQDCLEQLSQLL